MKIELAPINADRKINPYRQRSTGNLVYVYNIQGTPEEIVAYKAANPKAVTDTKTGHTLFFTTNPAGKTAELVKGEKGWFVDTRNEDLFAALCKKGGVEYAKLKMSEMKD